MGSILLFVLPACAEPRPVEVQDMFTCEELLGWWAEEVVDYDPTIAGGAVPAHEWFDDPSQAVGPPDYRGEGFGYGAVALGRAGYLDLSFERCHATTSGDAEPDLRVHEVGPQPELISVAIAPITGVEQLDPALHIGDGFYLLYSGSPHGPGIDLDAAIGSDAGVTYDRVRLIDDPEDGSHGPKAPGADIDAIEPLFMIEPDP